MRRSGLPAVLALALLSAAGDWTPVRPQTRSQEQSPAASDGDAPPDFQRLAMIEQAVDWFIRTKPVEAEGILASLTKQIEVHAGVLEVSPAAALPQTVRLLAHLAADDRVALRVMGPNAPIVQDGFAGMRLGNTIYLPRNLEQRADSEHLPVVLAHELNHDNFDVVRKHLHRQIDGITEAELLWLDLRLELQAHVGAMATLAGAGHDPELVVKYVRGLNAMSFSRRQMRHLLDSAARALSDLKAAIQIAKRLH